MSPDRKVARSQVKIINLNNRYRLNVRFVKNITSKILQAINKHHGIDLEIIFLSDGSIKKLNKRYKRHDSPTDVLSFKIDRREFGSKNILGEIFISLDRAARNSEDLGTAFESEVVLYVIHGMLHLFGYDDLTRRDFSRMSKAQERILESLWKKENLSKVLMPR